LLSDLAATYRIKKRVPVGDGAQCGLSDDVPGVVGWGVSQALRENYCIFGRHGLIDNFLSFYFFGSWIGKNFWRPARAGVMVLRDA